MALCTHTHTHIEAYNTAWQSTRQPDTHTHTQSFETPLTESRVKETRARGEKLRMRIKVKLPKYEKSLFKTLRAVNTPVLNRTVVAQFPPPMEKDNCSPKKLQFQEIRPPLLLSIFYRRRSRGSAYIKTGQAPLSSLLRHFAIAPSAI